MRIAIRAIVFSIVAWTASAAVAGITSLDDIDYWVGEGANQAGFVIDWNDGKDAWAWGYRWDGSATGTDMLTAIVQDDPRLYAKLWDFGGVSGGGLGYAIIGLGLDRDLDGFAIDPATPFPADGLLVDDRDTFDSDGGVAADLDDSYGEGWFEGYWSYNVSTGNPYDGGTWGYSGYGASSRPLADGDWDGWSFLPGFSGGTPGPAIAAPTGDPAGVPEPSSLALLGLGSVAGWVVRRRRVAT
jgi:hypothetical protein